MSRTLLVGLAPCEQLRESCAAHGVYSTIHTHRSIAFVLYVVGLRIERNAERIKKQSLRLPVPQLTDTQTDEYTREIDLREYKDEWTRRLVLSKALKGVLYTTGVVFSSLSPFYDSGGYIYYYPQSLLLGIAFYIFYVGAMGWVMACHDMFWKEQIDPIGLLEEQLQICLEVVPVMRDAYVDGEKPDVAEMIERVFMNFLMERSFDDETTIKVLEYFSKREGPVGQKAMEYAEMCRRHGVLK